MPNITVRFERIDVNDDGEALEKGKLYWDLAVNGDSVTSRSSGNPLQVASGGHITLGQSRTVRLDRGDVLSITGFVAERDSGLSGKDDRDEIDDRFTHAVGWGAGPQEAQVVDKKLDCTLHYTVDVH